MDKIHHRVSVKRKQFKCKIRRASLYGLPNNGKGQALALLGLFKNHCLMILNECLPLDCRWPFSFKVY